MVLGFPLSSPLRTHTHTLCSRIPARLTMATNWPEIWCCRRWTLNTAVLDKPGHKRRTHEHPSKSTVAEGRVQGEGAKFLFFVVRMHVAWVRPFGSSRLCNHLAIWLEDCWFQRTGSLKDKSGKCGKDRQPGWPAHNTSFTLFPQAQLHRLFATSLPWVWEQGRCGHVGGLLENERLDSSQNKEFPRVTSHWDWRRVYWQHLHWPLIILYYSYITKIY